MSRALRITESVIDLVGLRRSRMGRQFIAGLNVIGERSMRLLYPRAKGPVSVDGHQILLADNRAPSMGFVTAMIHDRYEVEMKHCLKSLIRSGMTVFDVGAHVGYYTLMAARLVGPSGRVYAFEAEPENYAILKRNIELNGYTNVTCIPHAVSNRSGIVSLHVSRQGNDRHTIIGESQTMSLSTTLRVNSVTLDDFAASVGWPTVDVIKMDIEGAEPLAIDGMSELLGRSPHLNLVVEFAPELLRAGGADPTTFLNDLKDLGFIITPVETDLSSHALESANLPYLMNEIDRRGVINLLCQKTLQSVTNGDCDA